MTAIEHLRGAGQGLSRGDVAGAVWQLGRRPEGARAKAAAWRAAERRYLSAHQALDTLETVALLSPPPGQKEQVITLTYAPPAPTLAENAEPAPRALLHIHRKYSDRNGVVQGKRSDERTKPGGRSITKQKL